MKYNSAFFYSLIATSSLTIATNANAWVEKQEKPERWFEVEVILFSQLNNKNELKEQFPDGIDDRSLPSYQQSFDLLSPHLQPNLTRLKRFIPLCGEKDEQHLFLESLKNIDAPFPEKFQLIEQVTAFNMPDFNKKIDMLSINETSIETNQENMQTTPKEFDLGSEISTTTAPEAVEIQEVVKSDSFPLANTTLSNESNKNVTTFEYDLQKEILAKPIFSTKDICIVSQQEMESILDEDQLITFNIDSFGVDKIPTKLNSSGLHISDKPYLIADESLLLKDISQRLRWSKEFKPLLHFGWRQVGITQQQAIPLKLFAGEHIEHKYQQALTNYQLEVKKAQAIEDNLVLELAKAQSGSIVTDINTQHSPDIETNIDKKNRAFNQLFSQIEEFNDTEPDENNINEIAIAIDEKSLEDILNNSTPDEGLIDRLTYMRKPLQPWSLNGFIKIHLDHYLYITADLNIFNQRQERFLLENDQTDNIKLINFSQNRRVITGEIHYFDHPYIGMIIQIRRFDPTKPEGEQVSQAIK
jgi:hypothetical protein